MPINDLRQKVALSGIVAALFFSFSYILVGALYFPFSMPVIESITDKLIFAWECALFAVMPLAGGLVAVMVRTLLRPATLDGEPVLDGSRLDIHMRFVRDTASNLLLFLPVLFNLAIVLDGELMRIVPVFTSWFILARLHYWMAYIISPPHRIFGTAATVAPSLFFLVLCALLTLKIL
jgi:hypothetical protein